MDSMPHSEQDKSTPPCLGISSPGEACSRPIDVIIKSSDGARFGAHSEYLSLYSDAFPAVEFRGKERMETCALSERSEELRILLAFMHPGAVPSIRDISMQVLGRLAVAADKYGVYTLVELCKAVMGLRAKEDPFFVLCHAVDYHYCDLYESVAPLTISKTLEEANKGILSPTTFRAWVLWRNEHQQVKRFILDYSFQSSCPLNCPGCAKIQNFRNALILAFDAEGIGLNGTAMYQKLSSITQPTRLSSWSKSSYYQPWCSQRAKYLMQKLKEFIDGRQLRISDFL